MPRVLADGHRKFTILTTKPANPAAPTATELNAGIDVSCKVLASDFKWTATASDTVDEQALCDSGKSPTPTTGNYDGSMTLWREYLAAGGIDPTGDEAFAAVKEKGTTLWAYDRLSDKEATENWAATDEFHLGAEIVTDTPQLPDGGGWIKYTIPLLIQKAWDFGTVGAGA